MKRGEMKALLLGYYGARNLGDDMMLHCILQWLAMQGMSVTVVSEDPQETGKRFSVPVARNVAFLGQWGWRYSWLRGHALRLIGMIRSHDLLVVGGGDLIRDDKGWRTLWYTIEKIIVALIFGKKVYLLNIGIVAPVTVIGKMALRFILKRCSKIIVRDESSFRTCIRLGNRDSCMLQPDIVLSLPSFLGEESSAAAKNDVPYILVCLRMEPDDFGTYPYGEKELTALAAALDEVTEESGAKVVFIPFQYDQNNDDNLIHHKIVAKMRRKEMAGIEEWSSDLLRLSEIFRGASCVVAMRLHAAVLAVAFKRPVVVMPYDRKVTEFADLAGISSRIDSKSSGNAGYIKELITGEMDRKECLYNHGIRQEWKTMSLTQ
jgi:polysaccharide pyruvyl transferase CsaB